MKFSVKFLNLTTRQTERYQVEAMTMGQALTRVKMLTFGKEIKDFGMWEEEWNN